MNWFSRRRQNDPLIPRSEGSRDIKVRLNLASSQMFANNTPIGQPVVWPPSHKILDEKEIIAADTFENQYCYPLILLPFTTKLYQHFEGFKERIITIAQNMIAQATEIFLIGYRAEDEVIKEMFEAAKPKALLNVVNLGDEARFIRNKVLDWKLGLQQGGSLGHRFCRLY